MEDVLFLTKGFVTKQRGGPLSITVLTPSQLLITDVTVNAQRIADQIAAGMGVQEATARLSSLNKRETSIPIDGIRSLRWMKRETELRITWDDERGRSHTKTTYIQKDRDRQRLIELVEQAIGHQFQRREEPAGFWRLAWSQMLGAVLSVAGTVVIQLLWDPQMIAQIRHGWIVLKLGRVGCALVGLAFFVGCLISAWRRVNSRPVEYHCIV